MHSLPCVPFLLAACSLPAFAQYTVKTVIFEGKTPYSQADLEATSGLKPGQALDETGLQTAAQRLNDTGAFDDLQVTLDGPVKSVNVVFKVKAANPEKMMHVSYRNFVWWTAEELVAELHRRVPMSGNLMPEAGSLQTEVQTALEAMLIEKGIASARVREEVVDPKPGAPYRAASYSVTFPSILLKSVRMSGASADRIIDLRKELSLRVGRPYTTNVDELISDIFKNAGLLDATFTPIQHSLETTGDHIDVTLLTAVNEGTAYHLRAIAWQGNDILSAEDFASRNKTRMGDLASQRTLRELEAIVQEAYQSHGYMDALVDATAEKNDTDKTVAYTLRAEPGAIYRLKSVTADNLTPQQKMEFDSAWRLKPSDIYNGSYVSNWLKQNTALKSFEGYSATFKTTTDPYEHTVDLVLHFIKGGALTD